MKWLLALLTLIGLGSFALPQAHAQQWQPGGTGLPMVCAYNGSAPTYTDKWFGYVQCDINGNLKTTGGGGGSGATAYLQTNAYTPITTSGSSASTTISAGSPTVVVAVNVGSTNGAYCAPGATATSSDHYLAPGGGWFAWNPNSATTLACIQAGGATTVNVTGGSGGLPTGSGGGGGGGGTVNATVTDCSGTITTGGTAQNAIAAQTTLHQFTITNSDPSTGGGEPLFISLTTTATVGNNYPLAPPTALTFAGMGSITLANGTNHAISIIGATTGHKFGCFWS